MGTSLNGLTPSATYTGLLKFGDNSAISGSLKAISDGAGNDTMIQLSTTALQIGGSTGMFWDNTNKRLGVGTSAPGAPLTVVGNIFNLASNGKRWNTSPQGTEWRFASDSAEIMALYDNGVKVSSTPSVAPTARLQIVGSGSTSATTSLLVQNSAGTTALEVKDNLTVGMGGAYVTGFSGFGATVASITAVYPCFLMNSTGGSGSKIGFNMDTAKLYFSEETNGSTLFGHRIMADTRVGGLVVLNNTAAGSTASLNASAVLQADSTTRGFLPPRMTTTQKNAISSPAAGLVVYDTTLAKLCVYTTTWETITSL